MFREQSIESYMQRWDEMQMYYQDDGTLKCRSKEPCPLDLEIASQHCCIYDIYSDLKSVSDVIVDFSIDDVSNEYDEFETRNFDNSSIYRTQSDYSDYYKFYFQKGFAASFYDPELRKSIPAPGFDGKKTLLTASRNYNKFTNHWFGTPEHPQSRFN